MMASLRTAVIFILFLTADAAQGQAFPGFPTEDFASALGAFAIRVAEPFAAQLSNGAQVYPGFDPVTKVLRSPILVDHTAVMGRSAPHRDGSFRDRRGTVVGASAPLTVADSDFPYVPTTPAFTPGPAGRSEVHFRVTSLALRSGVHGCIPAASFGMRAGLSAPARPHSIGEVESIASSIPGTANDFPAENFLSLFVELDLPSHEAFPPTIVYNSEAIITGRSGVAGFPLTGLQRALNVHAVPLFVHPGGQFFGWLVGFGFEPGADCSNQVPFEQAMAAQTPLPILGEWQVNQPRCDLEIASASLTGTPPIRVNKCSGELGVLGLHSLLTGQPWDVVATSPQPGVPASAGGVTLADGQIVNLDTSASLSWLNGGFTRTWAGPVIAPFLATTSVTAQMVILDPATASGASLSAANELAVSPAPPPQTVYGPVGDDSTLLVSLGTPALPVVTFMGTTWNEVFVNSNGSLTFGGGSTDATPSVAEFAAQVYPRAAGMWTDLSPNAGGTIETTITCAGLRTRFRNVPQFASPFTANQIEIFLARDGSTTLLGYAPDPAHVLDTLIGVTPGGGALDTGPVSFSSLTGLGFQSGPAHQMVYEFATGAAVPAGWSSVVFVKSDATLWFVN